MKKILITIAVVMSVFLNQPNTVSADPSSEKFAVFEELIRIIGAEAQYRQVINLIMGQFKNGFVRAVNKRIENAGDMTAEKKAKLRQLINQYMQSSMRNLEERFYREIPFSDIVKNVYYPVYDKHFDTFELKDLLAYYKTPIGKKFISLVPVLMRESMSKMNMLYDAKIQKMSQEVVVEEMKKLKPEIDKLQKE